MVAGVPGRCSSFLTSQMLTVTRPGALPADASPMGPGWPGAAGGLGCQGRGCLNSIFQGLRGFVSKESV